MSSLRSRVHYYATSAVTLLRLVRPHSRVIAMFLGLPGSAPAIVSLVRPALTLEVRDALDVWIVKETCIDDEYLRPWEPLDIGWSIIDIGAGIGEFSVFASLHRAALVHAYEPDRPSFDMLDANIMRNGCDSVVAHNEAIGSARTSYAASSDRAVLRRFRPVAGDEGVVGGITVADAIERLPDRRCDLLKLDCEGAEFDIVLGADAATFDRIERIVAEVHDNATGRDRHDLVAALTAVGYRTTTVESPVHEHLCLVYAERDRADTAG